MSGAFHLPASRAVIDLDNILHAGFEARTVSRPQDRLHYDRFVKELRQRGVSAGTVCRHKPFSQMAEQYWERSGFKVCAARANCDRSVSLAAISHVLEDGCRDLIVVAGDGDYHKSLSLIRACGVRIEIWSRKHRFAPRLRAIADRVRYIDHLILPRRCSHHHCAATQAASAIAATPSTMAIGTL